jgi:hypothetical protein
MAWSRQYDYMDGRRTEQSLSEGWVCYSLICYYGNCKDLKSTLYHLLRVRLLYCIIIIIIIIIKILYLGEYSPLRTFVPPKTKYTVHSQQV